MRAARDIKRVLEDERGVSIVFAMLLLVVLLILGGIILSYGYSGYRRATQDVSDERAAYNVRSAAELVRGQFAGKEDWAVRALAEAAGDELGQDAERTLSVQGTGGASFADVTVRVKHTTGITYDVAVFEKDAMKSPGSGSANGNQNANTGPVRLNGLAYHFTASYSPDSQRMDVGTLEKVGQ